MGDHLDPTGLLEDLATLDTRGIEILLETLPPDDVRILETLLPADPAAIARARRETADGTSWLRRIAPSMYPLEPGHHHRYLIDLLPRERPEGRRALVAAFRGSGKSTTATVGMPLLALVRQSHRFVVVIRETLPEAVTVVDGLRRFLEERPDLLDAYPWARPLPGEKGELRTVGGSIILARSAHGAIRGLQRTIGGKVIRPDLVIGDDVYDDEAARSAMQTERLEEWLLGTVGGLAGPAGESGISPLDVIVIGTTIEQGDLVSRILEGRGPFASWRRARIPAEAKVVERSSALGIPDDVDEPLVAVDTAGTYVPIPVPPGSEAGDRLAAWAAGAPTGYLDRLQDPTAEAFVGSRMYAREYLLRPRQPGDALFDRDNTRWISGLADRILDATIPSTRAAVAVDPATGEGDDYSAVAVTALVRLGDVDPAADADVADRPALVVCRARRDRVTLARLLDWVETVGEEWSARGPRVAFEAQGAFQWGAQELSRRRKVSVRPIVVDRSKHARALPLSVWHEAGRVFVDESLRGTPWDDEFHTFTGSDRDDHDDLTDATVHGATYSSNAWRTR